MAIPAASSTVANINNSFPPELLEGVLSRVPRRFSKDLPVTMLVCRLWRDVTNAIYADRFWTVYNKELHPETRKFLEALIIKQHSEDRTIPTVQMLFKQLAQLCGPRNYILAQKFFMHLFDTSELVLKQRCNPTFEAAFPAIAGQLSIAETDRLPQGARAHEMRLLLNQPNYISQLREMPVLNFQSIGLYESPLGIENCIGLIVLDFSHNHLFNFPLEAVGLPFLRHLNLGHNNLVTIPDSIGEMTSLRTLNLENNALSSLPNTLTKLINLQEINIQQNDFEGVPPVVMRLPCFGLSDMAIRSRRAPTAWGTIVEIAHISMPVCSPFLLGMWAARVILLSSQELLHLFVFRSFSPF